MTEVATTITVTVPKAMIPTEDGKTGIIEAITKQIQIQKQNVTKIEYEDADKIIIKFDKASVTLQITNPQELVSVSNALHKENSRKHLTVTQPHPVENAVAAANRSSNASDSQTVVNSSDASIPTVIESKLHRFVRNAALQKNWKERTFVLDSDGNLKRYNGSDLRKTKIITGSSAVTAVKDNSFIVNYNSTTTDEFIADTKELANQWKDAINGIALKKFIEATAAAAPECRGYLYLSKREAKGFVGGWHYFAFYSDGTLNQYSDDVEVTESKTITAQYAIDFADDMADRTQFTVTYDGGEQDTFKATSELEAERWIKKIKAAVFNMQYRVTDVLQKHEKNNDLKKIEQNVNNLKEAAYALGKHLSQGQGQGGRRTTKTRSRRNTPRKSTRTRQRHGRGARNTRRR